MYLGVCISRKNLSDEIVSRRKRRAVITIIDLCMSLNLPWTLWAGIPLFVQREGVYNEKQRPNCSKSKKCRVYWKLAYQLVSQSVSQSVRRSSFFILSVYIVMKGLWFPLIFVWCYMWRWRNWLLTYTDIPFCCRYMFQLMQPHPTTVAVTP